MNSLSNSALRAQLGNSLRQLQIGLRELADYFRTEARDAWVWQPPAPGANPFSAPAELSRSETLAHIAAGIQAIKYEDGQDSHESRIFPGVVVVAEDGVRLTNEVNGYKRSLAETLRAMEERTEEGIVDLVTGERGPRPLREIALESFFFRRLHYWQATRRFEVLVEDEGSTTQPEYLGFLWANSREVRRTSREQLLKEANGQDGLALTPSDLAVLESLPVGEPLAHVRKGHTSPKANIRWAARNGHKPVSKIRIAVLPCVMLGDTLPARFRPLPPMPTPAHFRIARSDRQIEATPILPHQPIFRYLEAYRESKLKS
jgi:hypothetical protein